jgi:hypothetical protein
VGGDLRWRSQVQFWVSFSQRRVGKRASSSCWSSNSPLAETRDEEKQRERPSHLEWGKACLQIQSVVG